MDTALEPLAFPQYPLQIEAGEDKTVVFDPIRKKWVLLLPEEWVRQHVIQYLMRDRGYPDGLIAIEKGFAYQGMPQRADVIAYDRKGSPALLVECKAPHIAVDQSVFDQVARYNQVIRARYLYVTNGLQHYCSEIDWRAQKYHFRDAVPLFEDL